MKEHPILFADEMVRAVLDGRKRQTRRLAKPTAAGMFDFYRPWAVGDRLWVRECWTPDHAAFYPHFPKVYRADGYDPRDNSPPGPPGTCWSSEQRARFPFKWRPSIHMPRWASRITLEITGLRWERLQAISEADAIAEGFPFDGCGGWGAVNIFKLTWNSLYGKKPGCDWNANPYVWVIQFERAT